MASSTEDAVEVSLSVEDLRAAPFSEELKTRDPQPGGADPFLFLDVLDGEGRVKIFDTPGEEQDPTFGPFRWRELSPFDPRQPVLAQLRDPRQYPQMTGLSQIFESIRIYQSWHFGPQAPPRLPQPADQPNQSLLPDASNLGRVLNRLRQNMTVRKELLEKLRCVYHQVEDFEISVEGGTVQVFAIERGVTAPTPASRLSDGTLRWLALLAILLDPSPAPPLCLDEPELGLHPDLLPPLGRCPAAQRAPQ